MYVENSRKADFSVIRSLPPQNIEAEEGILGGLLVDSNAYIRIMDIFDPEAFYVPAHKQIYNAIARLHELNRPIDMLHLIAFLQDHDMLERIGGRNRLVTLVDRCVSAVNIDSLAELVTEKYLRRKLIALGTKISQLGGDTFQELEACIDQAQQEVFEFAQNRQTVDSNELVPIGEVARDLYEKTEQLAYLGKSPGFKTGFYDVDNIISAGLEPGQLFIVGGRPSMGKSAWVQDLAWNVAKEYNRPVFFFSLEMSKDQLTQRQVSKLVEIQSDRIKTGRLTSEEWKRFAIAVDEMSEVPLDLNDRSDIDVKNIKNSIRKAVAKKKEPPALIAIDYLQLLTGTSDEDDKDIRSKITNTSRQLKQLAGELKCPIIALSQLSRSVESRQNKRPVLSDLRESGSIEQDADIVAFLYRDEYYNPNSTDRGLSEVIIAKQRDGKLGTVKLLFDGQYTKFKNLANPDF